MTTTVILDPDRKSFAMRRGEWTSRYPVSDLPKWLAFYRRQQEIFPAQAEQYAKDFDALEKLAASLAQSSAVAGPGETARTRVAG